MLNDHVDLWQFWCFAEQLLLPEMNVLTLISAAHSSSHGRRRTHRAKEERRRLETAE